MAHVEYNVIDNTINNTRIFVTKQFEKINILTQSIRHKNQKQLQRFIGLKLKFNCVIKTTKTEDIKFSFRLNPMNALNSSKIISHLCFDKCRRHFFFKYVFN